MTAGQPEPTPSSHTVDTTRDDGASPGVDASESFAAYLAKRLVGEKRFRPGVPKEAAKLAEASDVALFHAELGLQIACILDRETHSRNGFALSQQELIDLGSACLKYTGTVNGVKMPVAISLYEVAAGPPSDDDVRRLESLKKSAPGRKKVSITCFHLDVRNAEVWTSAPFQRLFRGLGQRGWLTSLMREPRKADREIFVADAVLPERKGAPVATVALLALLVAIFVVEQLAKLGQAGAGLLGVDAPTLFALGGMNANAVLKSGEWYRLLSAALLHGDALHLLFNGLALGLAGYFLESLLGRAWFVCLFFIGAIGGSLMGLLVNSPNIVSVGASGAVMGLLAATLVTAMRFPPGATRTQLQVQALQFLIPSLLPLATHQQGGQIDYAAHFGGAIAGALTGLLLMRLWPRENAQPRFHLATRGVAALAVASFAGSIGLARAHYPTYAAELAVQDLLIDDGAIPEDFSVAKGDVENWGKDHPRDPRVHLFRALHLLDMGNVTTAESELRAALGEREILKAAFGNQKLETGIRSVLCELLLQQGRIDEARKEAEPVCRADDGETPEELSRLGVCD